ncbi:MAG: signal peptidase II [Gemmatimonadaceae bacterium]
MAGRSVGDGGLSTGAIGRSRIGVRRKAGRPRLTSVAPPTRAGASLFWGTATTVIVVDLVTKLLAERLLAPRYVPHRVIGDFVRFTLAYNPGAAFSMSLGPYSRYLFGAFALVALYVLWRLYRMSGPAARAGDSVRILALGLAWGGACGNLIDRIRSPQGVVDFIDIGLSNWRFWTFNVADSAVTVGALVLAWSLSREEREERLARESVTARAAPAETLDRDATTGVRGPEA